MTLTEKKKIRIISDGYMTDFYLDGKKIQGLQEIENIESENEDDSRN